MVTTATDDLKATPVVARATKIVIEADWCKGCAICVEFCPKKVFVMNGKLPVVVNLEACNRCMLCEMRCPDFALRVI